LMVWNNDAVYGIAYDYTNFSDANPFVANWVYRISATGALTTPCPGLEGAIGTNVVFDRHGHGYTLGTSGVLQFSEKGSCKLVARFGADLDPQSINGDLTISSAEVVFGSTKTGKLFFVDFGHGTTRSIARLPLPPNAPDAFLSNIKADPASEGTLDGTFIRQIADGTVVSQLFRYRLSGDDKNLYLFNENVWMTNIVFASHDRFVASGSEAGYLLSPSGKVLSDKLPPQDYPMAVKGDQLFYTYQVVTLVPTNPPSRFPVTKTSFFIGRAQLDGTQPNGVADITPFGFPSSEVLAGSHGRLFVVTSPASGPHSLIEASNPAEKD
jgi:hypothetical protein